MGAVNYVSIKRLTWQERYDMYMALPKEELAKMLAESAKYTNPYGCAEFLKDFNPSEVVSVSSNATSEDNSYIYYGEDRNEF